MRNRKKGKQSSGGILGFLTSIFKKNGGRGRGRTQRAASTSASNLASSYAASTYQDADGRATSTQQEGNRSSNKEGFLSVIIKILKIAILLLILWMVIRICIVISQGADIVDAIHDAFSWLSWIKKIFS